MIKHFRMGNKTKMVKMSKLVQLVLRCVLLSPVAQLGESQCDVQRISGAVLQVLLPILNDIRDDIKRDIASLNETMIEHHNTLITLNETLSQQQETLGTVNETLSQQHETLGTVNQTLSQQHETLSTELANLQASLDGSHTKMDALNYRLTASMRQEFSSFESQAIAPALNTIQASLNSTLVSMRGDLSLVKTELITDIDDSTHMICDKMKRHDDHISQLFVHTCGGTGDWRRAVYLDMTDPSTDCPEGWNMTDYSKRTCGRASDGRFTCDSVTFPISGGEYSQVCGRIKAYQWGWTGGFSDHHSSSFRTVDGVYFTGVAVMHGSPRQHIWTFAAGAAENLQSDNWFVCPCDVHALSRTPPFINENYFCESGVITTTITTSALVAYLTLHSDDPLWDGSGCHSSSMCCSRNNPPYFTKTLDTASSDDIELRLCVLNDLSLMNIAVEFIELYVK